MRPTVLPAPILPVWRRLRAALRACAAAGVLACGAAGATGAAPETRWLDRAEPGFQNLALDQGLPNDLATAVAQDGEGYLWVGTAGGLARWDGYRFHNFVVDSGTPGSLPDNLVQVVHADRAGRIWVGTSSAGLARYEPATQRFVTLGAGPQALSHVSVRSLADDGEGGLWVGTDGGLDHVEASGRVTRVPLGSAAEASLPGDRVAAVLLDGRGRLWAGTPRGLFRRDAGSARFVAVPLPAPAGAGDTQAPHQPESLIQDSGGRIWVGTNRTGTFVIDADGRRARAIVETEVPPGTPPLSALRVMALAEAVPGEVWLATLGQGIVVVDVASGRTRRVRHRADLPSSLADNGVRGLYRDRSGLLWVATQGGLSRVDPRATAVVTMAGPHGTQRARTEYGALFTHSDGHVWMGTHADGLEIVDPRGGPARALRPDARHPASALPPDIVVSMAQADDGSVFVSTYRGLYPAAFARRHGTTGRPCYTGANRRSRAAAHLLTDHITQDATQAAANRRSAIAGHCTLSDQKPYNQSRQC